MESNDDLVPSTPAQPAPAAWGAPSALTGVNVPEVKTYLWASILEAFFCCQLTGVVAIVYGGLVQSRLQSGDIEGALDASRKARAWIIAGPVLWLLIVAVVGGLSLLNDSLAR